MHNQAIESTVAQTTGRCQAPAPGAPQSTDPLIHHNPSTPRDYIVIRKNRHGVVFNHYAVSPTQRILTQGLFLKRYDLVRDCLDNTLGLGRAQTEAILRLLRLWSYYGRVYPKAAQVAGSPGTSRASFWRAIRELEDDGIAIFDHRHVAVPHLGRLYEMVGLEEPT